MEAARGATERVWGDAGVNAKAPLHVGAFGLCLSGLHEPSGPASGRF